MRRYSDQNLTRGELNRYPKQNSRGPLYFIAYKESLIFDQKSIFESKLFFKWKFCFSDFKKSKFNCLTFNKKNPICLLVYEYLFTFWTCYRGNEIKINFIRIMIRVKHSGLMLLHSIACKFFITDITFLSIADVRIFTSKFANFCKKFWLNI